MKSMIPKFKMPKLPFIIKKTAPAQKQKPKISETEKILIKSTFPVFQFHKKTRIK